ncbi:LMBR1-like conserved region-containing protein [Heterostelium album PN500]|uniref:LMBR1-like conserved region-containing protein n=1 Tax=Heterostelium pallidum (strain ATCC 26659 / Pp 5 / PN500) TaxID=670386 RepID=D3BQK5_HETP5|nr:LMBR1-like conserved region-containing protein [Heterostelium album PN500]EFA76425.1 LMBR1-like conserved region-containing protein [Heterostelium album PN500]|eukprot:XP_020428557.1 LMBR1-like conserved region-containing protein [Heterostelium album PN500]
MVNIFMIIVCVAITVLIMLASLYLIVYFQHPDDKNVAYFPKIIVILGIGLASISILMLPLDVANKGGEGGFPMETLWIVVYIAIAVFAIVIVPFAMFFYESDEADGGNQFVSAIKGTIVILFVFVALTGILWILIGIAEIPTIVVSNPLIPKDPNFFATKPDATATVAYQQAWWSFYLASSGAPGLPAEALPTQAANPSLPVDKWAEYSDAATGGRILNEVRSGTEFLMFRVSIALFIITMVSFGGWLLFILFGGIGVAALPMDMISDFRYRPRRIPYDKYLERKSKIGERATELVDIGKEIQSKLTGGIMGRKDRRNYNRYRAAVFLLEEDYEHLKISYQRQGGKVIFYYVQFFLGFIAAALSITWVLQNILYMWTQPEPFFPFLNNMMISLDNAWGFLGTITYGVYAFYLLFCVVKGNFKFGLRLFFLFPIHPMKVGGTMMNAFLFNIGLILICCVSVTQFTTMAFSQYATLTSINSMFQSAVRNIRILKWFWVVYIIAFFIMAIISAIFLAVKPKDKPKKFKWE